MSRESAVRLLCMVTIVALGLAAGCGGPVRVQKGEAGPLNEFGTVYRQATDKLGRPPKSVEELAANAPAGKDVNSLLKSPNDNQPYVVVWGADPRSGMQLKPLVIAYEKEGLSGVRFVYTAMGVMLMGPDEFKEANFPQGHTP